MPLATEKTDAALTPGLLKILHKQVQTSLYQMHNAVEERWGWLGRPTAKYLLYFEDELCP